MSVLMPPKRNAAFVAVQAVMLAITNDNPAAAKACLEIALDEVREWNKERVVWRAPKGAP